VTGRQGGRRKQLRDNLKETTENWKSKEQALDRTLWRTWFRKGYGPVVRQSAEWTHPLHKRGSLWVSVSPEYFPQTVTYLGEADVGRRHVVQADVVALEHCNKETQHVTLRYVMLQLWWGTTYCQASRTFCATEFLLTHSTNSQHFIQYPMFITVLTTSIHMFLSKDWQIQSSHSRLIS
jgi:hypothetical protein